MSSICWLTARSDSEPARTVPSQVARSAASAEQQQEECEQQADPALDEPHGGRPGPALAAPGRRAALGGGHG